MNRRNILLICIGLYLLSAGVRFVVWQNNKAVMADVQHVVTGIYLQDARALLDGDLQAFLGGLNPPSDANILLHPPGYPIFIAAMQGIVGDPALLQPVQILVNSLAAVLVFFIALGLFGLRTAVIAGVLIALSPQFAYHSAIVLPDELSVLPILLAMYLMLRAVGTKSLMLAALCGASIGLSCWLRSNALLLPLFFAASSLILVPKEIRMRFVLAVLGSFILVVSPITIRNLVYFHAFIPLSVGMGTTFVEGLGDNDDDGTKGLPKTDEQVMELDARLAGRPDYYGFLYAPDGVERERARIRYGLGVIAEDPLWYIASVAERGVSTLRLERVPVIAADRDERENVHPLIYKLNIPLKLIQRVFITAIFLPMMIIGIVTAFRRRDARPGLVVLAIVPLYYMTVQALIHTEYRYVLASAHIMLIFAAVGLSFLFGLVIKPGTSDGAGLAGS